LPAEVAAALNAEYDTAFAGHSASGIDLSVTVDRTRQLAAVRCHPSQAVPGSVLWRRLDLLGDTEHARWLHDQTTNRDHRVPGQRQPLPPRVPQGPDQPETNASGRTTAARPIVEDAERLP
jgi:hypothetical protein